MKLSWKHERNNKIEYIMSSPKFFKILDIWGSSEMWLITREKSVNRNRQKDDRDDEMSRSGP